MAHPRVWLPTVAMVVGRVRAVNGRVDPATRLSDLFEHLRRDIGEVSFGHPVLADACLVRDDDDRSADESGRGVPACWTRRGGTRSRPMT